MSSNFCTTTLPEESPTRFSILGSNWQGMDNIAPCLGILDRFSGFRVCSFLEHYLGFRVQGVWGIRFRV